MFSVHSVAALFLVFALVYMVASTPLFRSADTPPSDTPDRRTSLDGLRGAMALTVYFHHCSLNRAFIVTGTWAFGSSWFFDEIGPLAVSGFFIITGFLFWGKVLKEGTRMRWAALYVGRLFRLAPAYLLTVGLMFLTVAWATRFQLQVPVAALSRQLGAWLMLGIGDQVPINGYSDTWLILAAVVWSLRWEWGFYASLPFLAPILGYRALRWVPVLLILVCFLLHRNPWFPHINLLSLFLVGMACAGLPKRPIRTRFEDGVASVCFVALVTAALALPHFFGRDGHPSAVPIVLVGLAFWLVVSGATLFGALTCRAARRVGDVSYPIYLLQGLVLTIFRWTPGFRSLIVHSTLGYWCLTAVGAVALLTAATVVHVLVERPGIAAGRALISVRRSLRSTA